MSTANNKPAESVSLNAFKQPRAFYLIFSIELWERFGYYGLQGIMAVYLVKQLGMSEADSITLFSSFSALVYGLVAIGGWLGDKVLPSVSSCWALSCWRLAMRWWPGRS